MNKAEMYLSQLTGNGVAESSRALALISRAERAVEAACEAYEAAAQIRDEADKAEPGSGSGAEGNLVLGRGVMRRMARELRRLGFER